MKFIVVCKSYEKIPLVEIRFSAKPLFAVKQIVQLTLYPFRNIYFRNFAFREQRKQARINIFGHRFVYFSVAQALVIRLHKKVVEKNIESGAFAATSHS